jgi:hypothetical protein
MRHRPMTIKNLNPLKLLSTLIGCLNRLVRILEREDAILPEIYEYTDGLGKLGELKCYCPDCPRVRRFKWQKLPPEYEWVSSI